MWKIFRASISTHVKLLKCYILASNHKREALSGMLIVKKFTIELQWYPTFKYYCFRFYLGIGLYYFIV